MSPALHDMGVAELGRALALKHVSSVEAAQHLLTRVATFEHLGAFLAHDAEASLADARAADARRARGDAQFTREASVNDTQQLLQAGHALRDQPQALVTQAGRCAAGYAVRAAASLRPTTVRR